MAIRKVNYSSIFSEKHYDKTFLLVIFVMFVFIFYGIYQIYSINNQGNSQDAKETPAINPDVPVSREPVASQFSSIIEFTQLPERVAPSEKFIVEWIINTPEPKFIQHTAVHYGYESKQGEFSSETTPAMASYEFLTPEFASGEYPIPNMFRSEILVTRKGSLYLRAHVIIDGKNYWTEEKRLSDTAEKRESIEIDYRQQP